MMTQSPEKNRKQIEFLCMDDLVPEDHLLRQIENAIDWSFIYDLVKERYSLEKGRPSIDPVTLIKIPLIQYMYGISSMRKTIQEIEVNVAYRWFLGLTFQDPVPHFSTFGKNYVRRFEGTDLFEQIFMHILEECNRYGLVDTTNIFVDATHVKARANRNKFEDKPFEKEALFYEKQLREEIDKDREKHGKKPLKEKDNSDDDDDGPGNVKTRKTSTNDPDSGWFHKGEHKQVFAYSVETACDKNGWVLGYTVSPGNEHDSRTFKGLYDKLIKFGPERIIADAGYKVPAIAKLLLDDGVIPVFPYKRPMTKAEFFPKYEYVYDEFNDCYICPENKILDYKTTNREGYKEYKSRPWHCANCPNLHKCTENKDHVKTVTRHIWEPYMEICEDIRHTKGMRELYQLRKETIERNFGTAKEFHGMRYTQLVGKPRMEMKVGLTFACMNLKKLVRTLKHLGITPIKNTRKTRVVAA